jgi:hypothetical protein
VSSNDDLRDSFYGWLSGVMKCAYEVPAPVVANSQAIPVARLFRLPVATHCAALLSVRRAPTVTDLGG